MDEQQAHRFLSEQLARLSPEEEYELELLESGHGAIVLRHAAVGGDVRREQIELVRAMWAKVVPVSETAARLFSDCLFEPARDGDRSSRRP
jgi:hypothetical protein